MTFKISLTIAVAGIFLLLCILTDGKSVQQLSADIQNPISPVFPNNIGNWWTFYKKDEDAAKTCILFKGAIQLQFTLDPADDSTLQVLDVPIHADVIDGSCGDTEQHINLFWNMPNKGYWCILHVSFKHAPDNTAYLIDLISLTLSNSSNVGMIYSNKGPGQDFQIFQNRQKSYSTSFNRSHLCAQRKTIRGNSLKVSTSGLRFEAFRPVTIDPYEFDKPELCEITPVQSIIPKPAPLASTPVHSTALTPTEPTFPNNIGNWRIFYTKQYTTKTCILLKGAIQLQFILDPTDESTSQIVDVPSHADVIDGSCAETEQHINLFWNMPNKGYWCILHVSFKHAPDSSTSYLIDLISLTVTNSSNPGASYSPKTLKQEKGKDFQIFQNKEASYPTSFSRSYICDKRKTIKGNSLRISTSDLQFEAFRPVTLDPYQFDAPEECDIVQKLSPSIPTELTPAEPTFPNNIGNWRIFHTKEYATKTCILLKGAIQLQFTLDPTDESTSQIVDVPSHADVIDGSCAETEQHINLFWNMPSKGHWFILHVSFKHAPDNSSYLIDLISLTVTDSSNPGALYSPKTLGQGQGKDFQIFQNLQKLYPTSFNRSFLCDKRKTIRGSSLRVSTSGLQFEAFRPVTLDPYKFDSPEVCDSTQKPNPWLTNIEPSYPNNIGNWSIRYPNSKDDSTCIYLTGAFQLHFIENTTSTSTNHVVDVPANQTLMFGSCGDGKKDEKNSLFLAWEALDYQMENEDSKSAFIYGLQMNFSLGENDNYFISHITLGRRESQPVDLEFWNVEPANWFFEDESLVVFKVDEGKYLTTSLNRSCTCSTKQTIKGDLIVEIANLRFEAFRPKNLKPYEFDAAEDCGSGHAANVGIIISVFCVLVLVAVTIFIGIRRNWIRVPVLRSNISYPGRILFKPLDEETERPLFKMDETERALVHTEKTG